MHSEQVDNMQKPLLIAHRGDRKNFSENTLEAFDAAFANGADGIECDVQIDAYGDLIIVHDYIYDTNASYPRLADILERYAGKGRIEIELKFFEKEGLQKVANIIEEYKNADIEITSSISPLLIYVKEILPDIKTGLIFKKKLLEDWMTEDIILKYLLGYFRLTHADILHLDLSIYTPAIVLALKQNNCFLHTHLTSANLEEYQKIVYLGIDQCTFDDIDILQLRKETTV